MRININSTLKEKEDSLVLTWEVLTKVNKRVSQVNLIELDLIASEEPIRTENIFTSPFTYRSDAQIRKENAEKKVIVIIVLLRKLALYLGKSP